MEDLSLKKNIIEVKSLSKSFKEGKEKKFILKDVSFNVKEGSIFFLVGPSGVGKSTILRILSQLESFDSGEIFIDGLKMKSSKAQDKSIQRKTSLVFQNYSLFPHMTVLENLTLSYVYHMMGGKEQAREKAEELLEKVGLADKKDFFPCTLSGGQKQKVSIARSLMLSPRVLFLDEPTSALDSSSIASLLEILNDIHREGTTLFVVSHDLGFTSLFAESLLYLSLESYVLIEDLAKIKKEGYRATEEEKKVLDFLKGRL